MWGGWTDAVVGLTVLAVVTTASADRVSDAACYVDTTGRRLYPHQPFPFPRSNLTVESCGNACRGDGYAFAGVEAAHACFCGHALPPGPSVPDHQCCAPCAGNASEACGDRFRLFAFPSSPPWSTPTAGACTGPDEAADPRNILNGTVMLRAGYLDQPYCVVMGSGRWVCTITMSAGGEGSSGEHVAALWSDDAGKSWSSPLALEPSPLDVELANAYSTTILAPGQATGGGDRIIAVYGMNLANVTVDPATHTRLSRTDCQGDFVSRYSDDGGATWSDRTLVPYPLTAIDYGNEWNGSLKLFWTVDQTKVRDGVAYFAFTKIGRWLLGPPEEMWFMYSDNILHESNFSHVTWKLGPTGGHGLPPPFLPVGDGSTTIEEAHLLPLRESRGFVMIGRTTTGYLASASTGAPDALSAWSSTAYAQYYDPARGPDLQPLNLSSAFGGRAAGLKNPRGPITAKVFNTAKGPRWLLLFYNNNWRSTSATADARPTVSMEDESRNPYWLAGGIEVGGDILWSQPDVVLFGRETTRPGYPDFVQDPAGGLIFITETQKTIARLHQVPQDLLRSLWSQPWVNEVAPNVTGQLEPGQLGGQVTWPSLDQPAAATDVLRNTGLTIEVGGVGASRAIRQGSEVLFDGRPGLQLLRNATNGAVYVVLEGPNGTVGLTTDSVCTHALNTAGSHHVTVVADHSALILRIFVDGVSCDGGGLLTRGFAFLRPIGDIVSDDVRAGDAVRYVRYYKRALLAGEVIGNMRHASTAIDHPMAPLVQGGP